MELLLHELQFCESFVGFQKTITLDSVTVSLSIVRRKSENLLAIICNDVKLIDDSKIHLLQIFKVESIVLLKPQDLNNNPSLWIVNEEFLWFGKKLLICKLKEENIESVLPQHYRTCYVTIYTQNNPTFEDVKQLLLQDERVHELSDLIKTLTGEDYVIGEFKSNTKEDYFELDKCVIDYANIFPVVYACLYSQKELEDSEPYLM